MSDIISNSASSDLSSYDTTERSLPILPVRDTVLFPHAVLPLTVGRESSVQLINSLGEDKTIVVVAQREARRFAAAHRPLFRRDAGRRP